MSAIGAPAGSGEAIVCLLMPRLAALGETELAKQSQAVREGLDTYIKTFAAAPPIAAPKRLAKRSAIFSFVV